MQEAAILAQERQQRAVWNTPGNQDCYCRGYICFHGKEAGLA